MAKYLEIEVVDGAIDPDGKIRVNIKGVAVNVPVSPELILDIAPECGKFRPSNGPNIPYKEIMQAWNRILPEVSIRALSDTRKKLIKARWLNEADGDGNPDMQSVERWEGLFRYIRESSFLMGETGWTVSFDFVVKAENMLKIREGKYHRGRE